MRRLLVKALRWEMNRLVDRHFHPRKDYVGDFLAHYLVERATGLPSEVIVAKAVRYYGRELLCQRSVTRLSRR